METKDRHPSEEGSLTRRRIIEAGLAAFCSMAVPAPVSALARTVDWASADLCRPVLRSAAYRSRRGERLADFYRRILGGESERTAAGSWRVSAGSETLLEIVEDRGLASSHPHAPGLFHMAFLFPNRADWLSAVHRLRESGAPFFGASDHGVSHAVYSADPDGHGVELAWDKPEVEWPRSDGRVAMTTRALDLRGELANHSPSRSGGAVRLGHVHLQTDSLGDQTDYRQSLGLAITQDTYPGALFLARGRYHHHLALNVWRVRPGLVRNPNAEGLFRLEWDLPGSPAAWEDRHGLEFVNQAS
ncbi:MAG: VOC family protein [Terrimicrobiaceae bacterium]|nr:VOC family protein [Terrimicrobiaceae bacterium]